MSGQLAFIGFGEAAQAFAGAEGWKTSAIAFDRLTDAASTRDAKLADYQRNAVQPALSLADALRDAGTILSLVTADQALFVAQAARPAPDAVYCDMNSVSPATKQRAAAAVEAAGARYVDVAIMSPVNPARLAVPLLLSGSAAEEAAARLDAAGFTSCQVIGHRVGQASAVKMIRSVIVKGLEALSAEAMLAADAAGVTEQVIASLDASGNAGAWSDRIDYNLERMMVHGLRRADEMEEAVKTLESLGVDPALTRGTVTRQRAIGALGLDPSGSLETKLERLRPAKANAA